MKKDMYKRNSTKKNLVYNMIYQITAIIIPFITAPYLSRTIGADGIGIYSYYNSISLYFGYFALLGISNYGNRLIAKEYKNLKKRNEIFSSLYYFQLIISILVSIAFTIYAMAFSTNVRVTSIFIIYVIASIFDISWLFFGMQEFKITSIRQILIRIVNFIFIFICVKSKNDINIYIFIMCFGTFLSSFSLWCIAWKRVKIVRCSIRDIFKHFKPCIILFIPIIATSVYRTMDKIMIGKFENMYEVGIYENSEKLIYITTGIISAFTAVIMPKISNYVGEKRYDEVKEIFYTSMEFAIFIGVALGAGIISISKEFIPLYFGSDFDKGIGISIGLATTVPIMTISCIIRTLHLIPFEKDNIYIKSVIVGALVNFVMNIMLIPIIGTLGAVIGTIIAELAVLISQITSIKEELNNKRIIIYLLKFSIIGIIMVICVRMVALLKINNYLKVFFELTIGISIYIILSIIYFYNEKNKYLYDFINKFRINKN